MASDNAQFKAQVTIDFTDAKKASADLANAIAQLNSMLEKTNPELTRAQTGLAKIATGAQQATKAISGAQAATKGWSQTLSSGWAQQFKQQLDAMQKSAQSFNKAMLQANTSKASSNPAFGNTGTGQTAAQVAPGFAAQAAAINDAVANRALASNAAQLEKVRLANVGATSAIQARINATTGVTRATTGITAANSAFNQSTKQAAQSTDQFGVGLASTQYALYNVASTLTSVGRGLLTFATAPAAAAIAFQSDFAQVSRTVTGATGDMMKSLEDLSTQIPATFADITEIASLGGQLGIASGDIVDFTSVVAKLTATTNLSAEEAGTLLGRFQEMTNLPASEFDNLASAVLAVGINSVATEKQIAQIASALAGVSRTSGFTAPQLIALAGALGSIGSGARQVQAASGSITRFLSNLQTDILKSNQGLDSFAKVAGVSADTVRKTFGTDKFAGVFDKFIQGLHDIQPQAGAVNQALADIGLTGVQDQRVFNNLGAASKLLSSLMKTSANAFKSAAVLNTQYNKIADTTASKIKILGNTFQVFLADMGGVSGGAVGGIASFLTDILKRFDDLARNPIVQWVAAVVAGLTGLVGILSLVGGGAAISIAGVIALTRAIVGLTGAEITSTTITGMLAEAFATMGTAGKIAAISMKAVGIALKAITVAAIAFAAVEVISALSGWVEGTQGVVKSTNDLTKAAKTSASAVGKQLGDAMDNYYNKTKLTSSGLNGFLKVLGSMGNKSSGNPLKDFAATANNLSGFLGNDFANILASMNLNPITQNVQNLDKSLVSMVKSGQTLKAASIFDTFSAQAKESGKSMDTVNGEFPKYIAALKAVKQEQGNLAQATGVTSDFISQLSDATGMSVDALTKYAAAYAKSVQPLTDLSSAIGQVQQAQADQIAASKAGQSLADYQAQQNAGQAVSLSALTEQYNTNSAALQTWADNLKIVSMKYGSDVADQFIQSGYTAVHASVLQQLTDAAPAQGAAYVAAMRKNADLAGQAMSDQILASGVLMDSAGQAVGGKTGEAVTAALKAGVPIDAIMQQFNLQLKGNPLLPVANTDPAKTKMESLVSTYDGKTIKFNTSAMTGTANNDLANLAANWNGHRINWIIDFSQSGTGITQSPTGPKIFRASGGPVYGPGTETSDSIPARLSKNEWVIKASSVRKYGDGFMDALNRGRVRTFAGGGTPRAVSDTSGGMGGVVELGPTSLRRLAREVSVNVMLDDTAIYNASRRGAARAGNQGRF